MKNLICMTIVALLFVAVAATPIVAKCSYADKKALKKMDKAWSDANQARDKAALDAILSNDYAAFTLAGMTDKKNAMGNLDGPAPPPNNNVVISDNYIISCSGDTAVMTHRVEIRSKDAVNYARSVHVFRKSAGKWQVISSASHPMDEVGNLIYQNYTALNAYKKRDVKWLGAHTHDNFVSVDAAGKTSGKSEMLKDVKEYKTTFDLLRIEQIAGNVEGDSGLILVTYHAKGKSGDGTPFEGKRRFTRNYVRKDGKWLLRSAHYSQLEMPKAIAQTP